MPTLHPLYIVLAIILFMAEPDSASLLLLFSPTDVVTSKISDSLAFNRRPLDEPISTSSISDWRGDLAWEGERTVIPSDAMLPIDIFYEERTEDELSLESDVRVCVVCCCTYSALPSLFVGLFICQRSWCWEGWARGEEEKRECNGLNFFLKTSKKESVSYIGRSI
jgi:hypothetical protein